MTMDTLDNGLTFYAVVGIGVLGFGTAAYLSFRLWRLFIRSLSSLSSTGLLAFALFTWGAWWLICRLELVVWEIRLNVDVPLPLTSLAVAVGATLASGLAVLAEIVSMLCRKRPEVHVMEPEERGDGKLRPALTGPSRLSALPSPGPESSPSASGGGGGSRSGRVRGDRQGERKAESEETRQAYQELSDFFQSQVEALRAALDPQGSRQGGRAESTGAHEDADRSAAASTCG
uniref:Uncharacterized protein n=1 Tax=Chromera velia CCMP2878 TaxID=1169474 RepID=A0A0G4HJH6_9ALVE|mmetsp:Transcript_48791/g.96251  ORF Transcript_48791/g.96251 Transcript_48791/m.96251 type:complete len:232 (-) Transcript_48791:145-840(-)|eukprot:Cvel_7095.t1-p1 / transcript=Cvel_7095.t1 / gene=Cvel_7095 / organism=Chromera_velia_CCMP2878 / gene_product=hypothetical protein / transcript_product=hypothetical protein / location=Cvel_scaffold363:57924-59056(+) / protein_length=231 / sequence_SO=supercontig / SO=protein_coding / is_pseudo=false